MRHAGRQALTRLGSVVEITSAVPLCTPTGRLNPAAVGWSRRPLHTANLRGWGRTKRWEYWGIVTPEVIVGLTISSLDYLGVHSIVVVDRRSGTETHPHRAGAPGSQRRAARPQRRRRGPRAGAGAVPVLRQLVGWHHAWRPRARAFGSSPTSGRGPTAWPWWSPGRSAGSSTRSRTWAGRLPGPCSSATRRSGSAPTTGRSPSWTTAAGKWPYSMTWNWAAGYGEVAREAGRAAAGREVDRRHGQHRERAVRGRPAAQDPRGPDLDLRPDRLDGAVADRRPPGPGGPRPLPRARRADQRRW